MAKDSFGCKHTPVRPKGWELRIKATNDVNFILHYVRPEFATFGVVLNVCGTEWILFDVLLSFCARCGCYTSFGNHFDVCWLCQDEMEDF